MTDEVIGGFVPTRRFAQVTFESYRPDARYPSQHVARDTLRALAGQIGQARKPHLINRLIRTHV